jgi:hypothetical protein
MSWRRQLHHLLVRHLPKHERLRPAELAGTGGTAVGFQIVNAVSPHRLHVESMAGMTGMIRIFIACAAAALLLSLAANAAELPVPTLHHRVVSHRMQRHHVYVSQRHFGYYFGRWGWRSGGTASSWYGSTFVLAGAPWQGPAIVLKASPKGVARIHCSDRPDACLAEPLLAPVAVAEPWLRR